MNAPSGIWITANLYHPQGDSLPSAWSVGVCAAMQTIITARVPPMLLQSGRTVRAGVLLAAPRGRFTVSFEADVIGLLQQCRTVMDLSRPDHG